MDFEFKLVGGRAWEEARCEGGGEDETARDAGLDAVGGRGEEWEEGG